MVRPPGGGEANIAARTIQRQEMLRDPEDPMVTPDKKLIDLWGWY